MSDTDKFSRLLPREAWKACECPTHKTMYYRADSGWICLVEMTCSALIMDDVLMERVIHSLPYEIRISITDKERRAMLREIKRVSNETHSKKGNQ